MIVPEPDTEPAGWRVLGFGRKPEVAAAIQEGAGQARWPRRPPRAAPAGLVAAAAGRCGSGPVFRRRAGRHRVGNPVTDTRASRRDSLALPSGDPERLG